MYAKIGLDAINVVDVKNNRTGLPAYDKKLYIRIHIYTYICIYIYILKHLHI
jgi:hypothetical protein